MAYKTFVNGYPLTASELNQYLMNQAIPTFTDTTARDAAITSPVHGQFAYLTGTDLLTKYDGSSWVNAFSAPTSAVYEKSVDYTIVSSDADSFIYATDTITVTVADVLSAGQTINFIQNSTGAITFAADTGVTLRSKDGLLDTNTQYSGVSLTCKAAGVYYLVGDLA